MIDQDATHHLCSDREEVGTVLPLNLLLINKSEICLVNQGGRLKGVAGALTSKVAGRVPAQFSVY
jgi:hypothetical protein